MCTLHKQTKKQSSQFADDSVSLVIISRHQVEFMDPLPTKIMLKERFFRIQSYIKDETCIMLHHWVNKKEKR